MEIYYDNEIIIKINSVFKIETVAFIYLWWMTSCSCKTFKVLTIQDSLHTAELLKVSCILSNHTNETESRG